MNEAKEVNFIVFTRFVPEYGHMNIYEETSLNESEAMRLVSKCFNNEKFYDLIETSLVFPSQFDDFETRLNSRKRKMLNTNSVMEIEYRTILIENYKK